MFVLSAYSNDRSSNVMLLDDVRFFLMHGVWEEKGGACMYSTVHAICFHTVGAVHSNGRIHSMNFTIFAPLSSGNTAESRATVATSLPEFELHPYQWVKTDECLRGAVV